MWKWSNLSKIAGRTSGQTRVGSPRFGQARESMTCLNNMDPRLLLRTTDRIFRQEAQESFFLPSTTDDLCDTQLAVTRASRTDNSSLISASCHHRKERKVSERTRKVTPRIQAHCGNGSYFCPSLEFSRKVQFYVCLNVNTLYHCFSKKGPRDEKAVSVSVLWVVGK